MLFLGEFFGFRFVLCVFGCCERVLQAIWHRLRGPEIGCKAAEGEHEKRCKLLLYHHLPKWRNWQTRGIQNPVLATG